MHHSVMVVKQLHEMNKKLKKKKRKIRREDKYRVLVELVTHCPISEESSIVVSIQIRADLINRIEKPETGN